MKLKLETGYFFLGKSKASGLEQQKQGRARSTFRSLHNKKQCYRRLEQTFKRILEMNSKWFFFFSLLFLCVRRFPEVDAALWYGDTRAQKYEVKKFSRAKENRGSRRK